ncbi:hypothetical protein [Aliikangiella maris]|uniref:KfrA N-terminal DNA-binding domain-containing protein n=2 Tax=Aliikangiella maris TaxID=3162458 RepID=A0ABV3MLJ9_9GAMM
MEFRTNENQIECVRRIVINKGQSVREQVIVRFDATASVIPPHVRACLTQLENKQLQLWFKERKALSEQLSDESEEQTVLTVMPELLVKAQDALQKIEQLDLELFKRLKVNLRELDEQLNRFHALCDDQLPEYKAMRDTEVLKEKLQVIRASL